MPSPEAVPCRALLAVLFLLFIPTLTWTAAAGAEERPLQPLAPDRAPFSVHYLPDTGTDTGTDAGRVDAQTRGQILENFQSYLGSPGAGVPNRDTPYGGIGGDDVAIPVDEYCSTSIAITEGGDIYIACSWSSDGVSSELRAYRSVDGGTTWSHWGTMPCPDPDLYLTSPHCVVAEGAANRLFVAFRLFEGFSGDNQVGVAWADLSSPTAIFTHQILLAEPGDSFNQPRLVTDAAAFSSYYLYLVAQGWVGNERAIMFTRSTDRGQSWETPYAIASTPVEDFTYMTPDIAYGYGGTVHVVWQLRANLAAQSALRYRRALGYASGGESSWEPIQGVTALEEGLQYHSPKIAASLSGPDVGIHSGHHVDGQYVDPVFFPSTNNGESFGAGLTVPDGICYRPADLLWRPTTNTWVVVGEKRLTPDGHEGTATQSAPVASPASWGPAQAFSDRDYYIGDDNPHNGALDPSRDYQLAVCWADWPGETRILFDAEWRAEPGYPDTEPGFPVPLAAMPRSEPAVVDIDADGDLEIVFADVGGFVQVYHHDGTRADGWPVEVDFELSRGPVAAGDLTGDGFAEIVVGNNQGQVFCYDHLGHLMPGWPAHHVPGSGLRVHRLPGGAVPEAGRGRGGGDGGLFQLRRPRPGRADSGPAAGRPGHR